MPLLWDRSCTSLGGCPDGTRCAQATQSALVCDTGLIRDMVEPRLAAWTSAAMIHGRSFGADYPILYIGLLITALLAVVRGPCIVPRRHARRADTGTLVVVVQLVAPGSTSPCSSAAAAATAASETSCGLVSPPPTTHRHPLALPPPKVRIPCQQAPVVAGGVGVATGGFAEDG